MIHHLIRGVVVFVSQSSAVAGRSDIDSDAHERIPGVLFLLLFSSTATATATATATPVPSSFGYLTYRRRSCSWACDSRCSMQLRYANNLKMIVHWH